MIGFGSMDANAVDAQAATQVGEMADGVGRMVSVARALAESGRQVDLDGLDRHVGLLCAKALDLPPVLGRAQRVRLITLRAELDELTAILRQDTPDPVPTARD